MSKSRISTPHIRQHTCQYCGEAFESKSWIPTCAACAGSEAVKERRRKNWRRQYQCKQGKKAIAAIFAEMRAA